MFENIIPVELKFLKVMGNRPCEVEIIKEYIIEKYTKPDKSNRSEAILFRTYGWFDFFVIITNPRTRCSTDNHENLSSRFPIMETSIMGWYSESRRDNEMNNKNNTINSHYMNILEKIAEKLKKLSENGQRVVWEGLRDENGIIQPTELHVISFVKLKEDNEEVNTDVVENDTCVQEFMIIDCLGIWDFAILVKIREPRDLEKYKKIFLTRTLEFAQTTSIVLSPVR